MESVPFTNLYAILKPGAQAATRASAPAHTDARAFQSLLAEAKAEPESNPLKSMPSTQMLYGIGLPPQGLHRKINSQSQVDTARTALYEQMLQKRGIPRQMIEQLAAGGGTAAFIALRGVQPQGRMDARQAELR